MTNSMSCSSKCKKSDNGIRQFKLPHLKVQEGAKGRKGVKMTKSERKNWLINIENSAAVIESQLGPSTVQSVSERYGTHGIRDLRSSDLPDVFNELYAIEADLR